MSNEFVGTSTRKSHGFPSKGRTMQRLRNERRLVDVYPGLPRLPAKSLRSIESCSKLCKCARHRRISHAGCPRAPPRLQTLNLKAPNPPESSKRTSTTRASATQLVHGTFFPSVRPSEPPVIRKRSTHSAASFKSAVRPLLAVSVLARTMGSTQ